MTLTDLFDEEKDKLKTSLAAAGTPDAAPPVISRFLDRILAAYLSDSPEESCRAAAAQMIGVLKMAVPLIDSVGKTEVWERAPEASDGSSESSGRKRNPCGSSRMQRAFSLILLIAGSALAAAAVITAAAGHPARLSAGNIPFALLLLALGMLSLWLSGFLKSRPPKKTERREYMTENRIGADRILRRLRACLLAADQFLGEIAADARHRKRAETVSRPDALPENEIALLAGLLEALYSRDSEYTFRKLESIRYFLHQNHIETVEYSEDTARWFDCMPSQKKGTLRPALASDGHLLKKGVAGV